MAYSPELGQWMQQDPAGYVDGENLYEFLQDDPVENVDPLGLQTVTGQGLVDPGPNGDPHFKPMQDPTTQPTDRTCNLTNYEEIEEHLRMLQNRLQGEQAQKDRLLNGLNPNAPANWLKTKMAEINNDEDAIIKAIQDNINYWKNRQKGAPHAPPCNEAPPPYDGIPRDIWDSIFPPMA